MIIPKCKLDVVIVRISNKRYGIFTGTALLIQKDSHLFIVNVGTVRT
jgi:hypothetical protein